MLQGLTSNLRLTGHVGKGKGKGVPGRSHNICKGLEVRTHTACSWNASLSMWWEDREWQGKWWASETWTDNRGHKEPRSYLQGNRKPKCFQHERVYDLRLGQHIPGRAYIEQRHGLRSWGGGSGTYPVPSDSNHPTQSPTEALAPQKAKCCLRSRLFQVRIVQVSYK